MRNHRAPGSGPLRSKMASLLPFALFANPAFANEAAHTVDPSVTWLFYRHFTGDGCVSRL